MNAARIYLDVDAADLHPKRNRQYGPRWSIVLADDITLWGTRDELIELAERLIDAALEMPRAEEVAS